MRSSAPARDWPGGSCSLTTSSSFAAAGWSASMVGRLAFDQFVPEVKLTDMPRFVVSSTTIWESWTHSSAPQPYREWSISPSSMARNSMPPNPSRWAVSTSCRSVWSVCRPSASHQRSSGRYSMAGFWMSRTRSVRVMGGSPSSQWVRTRQPAPPRPGRGDETYQNRGVWVAGLPCGLLRRHEEVLQQTEDALRLSFLLGLGGYRKQGVDGAPPP